MAGYLSVKLTEFMQSMTECPEGMGNQRPSRQTVAEPLIEFKLFKRRWIATWQTQGNAMWCGMRPPQKKAHRYWNTNLTVPNHQAAPPPPLFLPNKP